MTRLTAKQYARALMSAYHAAPVAKQPTVMKNFLQLLVRRRLTKLLPRILEHVQAGEDAANNVTRVKAWTAQPTDGTELTAALKKIFGPIEVEAEVRPELVGGIRLQIGDQLVDGTLRNRLNRLQTQLTRT